VGYESWFMSPNEMKPGYADVDCARVLANTSSTMDVDREMPMETEGRLAKLQSTGFGFDPAPKRSYHPEAKGRNFYRRPKHLHCPAESSATHRVLTVTGNLANKTCRNTAGVLTQGNPFVG
jgi:hypothetical protein